MSFTAWAQIALALLKVANWAASKVDQAQWRRMGYQQAVDEQSAALRRSVGLAQAVAAETRKMTPEDILRDLDGNGELRREP